MSPRDEVEVVLRSWDAYERARGAPGIIDFDCQPVEAEIEPAAGRLSVLRRFGKVREDADPALAARIDSHIAYLRALMGERLPLDDYVRVTQGCSAAGWPPEYVTCVGETVRSRLDDLGIGWGPSTPHDLVALEGPIDPDAAPGALRSAAKEVEPTVRRIVDTDAPYQLSVETTNLQAYWAYWIDGSGDRIRLRLNLRNAAFTKVTVRQFALHEILGHGLKGASYAAHSGAEDGLWVRLLSVHSQHQVLLEGLGQTLPIFVTPDDEAVITRVKLEHYSYLVRAELHRAINSGASVEACVHHARARIPWWSDDAIADALSDRSTDPLLRSYLWAYPAGQDWFTHLSAEDSAVWRMVLRAAYRKPLTTAELAEMWPDGPEIGGSAGSE